MAAPELHNAPVAGEHLEPAANPEAAPPAPPAADSGWFEEFERVEKAFIILAGIFLVSALVAYLGVQLDSDAVFIAAIIVASVALVGMAGLMFPLGWILLKEFQRWRRRRATESGQGK